MTRSWAIGMAAIALVAGCSTASEPDRRVLQLRGTYENCLRNVYAAQRPRTDASSAAEAAFQSCQTEENAFQAYLIGVKDADPRAVMIHAATYRARLKAELIGSR